ncbi:MAG TPA: flippase [Candidatus Moranbacteria bacterium]|nr:flippase [Candidatus Moranbacteria bacterium]
MKEQHIAKSVFWLTISEIIFNISGYIIHSGVGRILGPADYGRYGLVITLTTMIIILIGNGIPTAMSKFLSEVFETNPAMINVIKNKALFLQTILISVITLIFFFSAPLIALALGDSSLTHLFRISTLIIPSFALASFYFYYFTGIHRFNLQATLKTVRSIAKVVFILWLAWIFKLSGSIIGYILAPFFVFLIAWGIDKFWISKNFTKTKNKQLEKTSLNFSTKKLFNYAWPFTLFLLFYEIMISIDLYMVKAILQNDFLTGIYNGSLTVGRIPYYLFYALTIVLLPSISKSSAQKDNQKTKQTVSQSLRLMSILLPLGAILMIVFAKPIIYLFYGVDYFSAILPMQILVVGVSFLTVFYVLSFAFSGLGKVKLPMWIAFLGMIANIILNYFLIRKNQLIGAATATSITSFFVMLASLYFTKKEFQASLKIKSILKIGFAFIITFFLAKLFPESNYLFILWSLILSSIYFIILYVLKEIKKEDINIKK